VNAGSAKAYANGLPSQAQKAQAAFRSAMAVGESANTPPEETAAGGMGDFCQVFTLFEISWDLKGVEFHVQKFCWKF